MSGSAIQIIDSGRSLVLGRPPGFRHELIVRRSVMAVLCQIEARFPGLSDFDVNVHGLPPSHSYAIPLSGAAPNAVHSGTGYRFGKAVITDKTLLAVFLNSLIFVGFAGAAREEQLGVHTFALRKFFPVHGYYAIDKRAR